jgi:N-acylneuraminate cytidylyltransferase
MRLAVIPARGGSKRIPRKNIKEFCGKPMIAWSIEAARKSGCFDAVVVSTDDDEIASIAREWGAEVPFLRPSTLADDHTGTIPVIRQAIEWYSAHIQAPEFVCCIYATAPFIESGDLHKGFNTILENDCDYAFSATSYASPIQRAFRIADKGRVEMFYPELFNTRSQDLEEAYHDAGQFYWGRAEAFVNDVELFSSASIPIILPRCRVQDIDTFEDWKRAEVMFKALEEA